MQYCSNQLYTFVGELLKPFEYFEFEYFLSQLEGRMVFTDQSWIHTTLQGVPVNFSCLPLHCSPPAELQKIIARICSFVHIQKCSADWNSKSQRLWESTDLCLAASFKHNMDQINDDSHGSNLDNVAKLL